VSQPSLWVQIRRLEEELGTPLLSRHARGVELTAAGKAFLPHAMAALDEVNQGKNAVTSLMRADANSISLGIMPTTGRALLKELVQRCKEGPRGPKLQIHIDMSDELYELFADGALDAAIGYAPAPINAAGVISLYEQELFLVGPQSILGGVGDVAHALLRELPLVLGTRKHSMRKFIDEKMTAGGIELAADFELEMRDMKRELVVRQGHCSIVPYGTFYDEIRSGELCARRLNPPLSRKVILVVHKNASDRIRKFLIPVICSLVKLRIQENDFGWQPIAARKVGARATGRTADASSREKEISSRVL
jgi:LysR family transcriptional regulator, nitrogen assimilation regulatory protein